MKHLITAALLAIASPAVAFDGSCDLIPDGGAILIGSNHVGATIDFNESNLGVFASWDCEPVTVRGGVYDNSLGNTSWAFTVKSEFVSLSAGGFNAAPFAGVAHYPGTGRHEVVSIKGSDWIGLAGLEFTHDDVPVFVQLFPGDQKHAGYDYLVSFGLRWDF